MSAIIISSSSSAPLPTSAHPSCFRGRIGTRLLQLALLALGSAVLCVIVLASPLGRVVDKGVDAHFERVNYRRENYKLT